jgi:ubiquinone/menaquinone biosynthesis C-methylase UbiE
MVGHARLPGHADRPIPLHIEQTHEAAGREGPEIISRLGDARRLEFPDRSMDAVLEFGPLYHLPAQEDRVRALSEAGRVTKPGGLIMVALISRFASLLMGCGWVSSTARALLRRSRQTCGRASIEILTDIRHCSRRRTLTTPTR